MQDYCEVFKLPPEPKQDEGFFLYGQMCGFLHRLLRRLVKQRDLPDASNWEKVRSFDFAIEYSVSFPEFVQKMEFRAKALMVAKSKTDVERDRGKKANTDVVARSIIASTFNHLFDRGRQYIR